MRRECDAWGNVIPVTLIQLRDNEVCDFWKILWIKGIHSLVFTVGY